jgi:hypothetical protein
MLSQLIGGLVEEDLARRGGEVSQLAHIKNLMPNLSKKIFHLLHLGKMTSPAPLCSHPGGKLAFFEFFSLSLVQSKAHSW